MAERGNAAIVTDFRQDGDGMSNTNPSPTGGPRQTDRWLEPGSTNALVIYILYLAGLVIGVTGLVGIVLAYINRGKAGGFVESHYTFLIRTFWIGLLYALISVVLMDNSLDFMVLALTRKSLIYQFCRTYGEGGQSHTNDSEQEAVSSKRTKEKRMIKRVDFTTQESITADSGARRPDMRYAHLVQ